MFTAGKYRIVFKRIWHSKKPSDGRWDTKCEIWELGEITTEVFRFTGIARLHPNDRPDKIIGKKIALQNAIGEVHPAPDNCTYYSCADFYNKSVRKAIWKAFWDWVNSWDNKGQQDEIHKQETKKEKTQRQDS